MHWTAMLSRGLKTSVEPRLQRIAQRILLLGSASSLSGLAWTTWRRTRGLTNDTAWSDFLFFYAAPLLSIAAALAIAALWPRVNRIEVVLTLAPIPITLVVAEICLQYMSYGVRVRAARMAAERLGYAFDARAQNEVIADLRKQGKAAHPFVRLVKDTKLVALGTIPRASVVACNEFGPWFAPETDRYGFVNPDTVWSEEAPLNAIVVGDSFAMGECDPTTGGPAAVLRESGQRVLNLGMGGNHPLLNLASLAEFGDSRHASVVFWLHFAGNDLEELRSASSHPLLLRYVAEPAFRQGLASRMPEVEARLLALEVKVMARHPSFASTFGSAKGWSRIAHLYAVRTVLGLARPVYDAQTLHLFGRILTRARQIVNRMGARLVVVSIPAAGHLDRDNAEDIGTAQVARSAGITYVDLRTTFRRMQSQDLYSQRYMGHLTPFANRLVAAVLLRYLRR